jgi:hypothetical protein
MIAQRCKGSGRYAIRCHNFTLHETGTCHHHRSQAPFIARVEAFDRKQLEAKIQRESAQAYSGLL